VAAGVARLPWYKLAAWSLVSLTARNALIVAAGMAVGANVQQLEALFRQYTTAVGAAQAVVGMGLLAWWAWKSPRAVEICRIVNPEVCKRSWPHDHG
jgi:membrane protein DedA with SNARE-associated domain